MFAMSVAASVLVGILSLRLLVSGLLAGGLLAGQRSIACATCSPLPSASTLSHEAVSVVAKKTALAYAKAKLVDKFANTLCEQALSMSLMHQTQIDNTLSLNPHHPAPHLRAHRRLSFSRHAQQHSRDSVPPWRARWPWLRGKPTPILRLRPVGARADSESQEHSNEDGKMRKTVGDCDAVIKNAHAVVQACVGGQPCELVKLSVSEHSAKAAPSIIVIPGNPGIPSFYTVFADMLARQFGASVVVLGLGGHTTVPSSVPFLNIQEQVSHAVAFLDEHSSLGEVTLIGHSIGAYIAIEAWRRRPSAVAIVIGITPYMENVPSHAWPNIELLCRTWWDWLAPVWCMTNLVWDLLRRLPKSLKCACARFIEPTIDASAADIAADAMGSHIWRHGSYLLRTEVLNHAAPYDWDSLNRSNIRKDKIRLLFSDQDLWASVESAERARKAGVGTTCMPGLPHAFSIQSAVVGTVVKWVVEQLRTMPK